jgi:hypothetical protein
VLGDAGRARTNQARGAKTAVDLVWSWLVVFAPVSFTVQDLMVVGVVVVVID